MTSDMPWIMFGTTGPSWDHLKSIRIIEYDPDTEKVDHGHDTEGLIVRHHTFFISRQNGIEGNGLKETPVAHLSAHEIGRKKSHYHGQPGSASAH